MPFSHFSLSSKPSKSLLETFFEDIIKQINAYERQYEITTELYREGWKKEITTLKEEQNNQVESARVIYRKIYEEMDGEQEQFKESYADHKSGLSGVHGLFEDQIDLTKKTYLDCFDSYNKATIVSLYSLVESKFKELCKIGQQLFGAKIGYELFDSRNYLLASRDYLSLVLEVSMQPLDKFFSKLEDIQFVRNRIVHSEAVFSDENLKIKELDN